MPDETYVPDFFDRDGTRLRCRACRAEIDYMDEGLDASYLSDHVGEAIGCHACGLTSRIPTEEEAEWPKRKDPGDPIKDVSVVERSIQNAPASEPEPELDEPEEEPG